MNRRQFMAAIAAGAVVTAEGLWMPGQKLISIPRRLPGFHLSEDHVISFEPGPLKPTFTPLELHRWLQDKADDFAMGGDDLLDITDPNPSLLMADQSIQLDDGWRLEEGAFAHTRSGTIKQINKIFT